MKLGVDSRIALTAEERGTLNRAAAILKYHMNRASSVLDNPELSKDWVRTHLGARNAEVFTIIMLDQRHRVISTSDLFVGTIDGCSIYPREIIKHIIHSGAAAVILAHNHPSGVPDPSEADKQITQRIKAALDLIDVRLLDHLIVGEYVYAFSERGLL